jgi:hypothetical protein
VVPTGRYRCGWCSDEGRNRDPLQDLGVVETEISQPLDVLVPDGLRIPVDCHGQIGEGAFAIREFGDLMVVDRHTLTERPVSCDLVELVRVVGMAIGATVFA